MAPIRKESVKSRSTLKTTALGRGQLARMFLPDRSTKTALRTFNRWMSLNKRLQRRLKESGTTEKMRYYTPKQVKIIMEELGGSEWVPVELQDMQINAEEATCRSEVTD